MSALRLPLLFRGDAMNPSSLAVLLWTSPPLLLFLVLKVRSGMSVKVASLWMILGLYAAWAAGLLFGEPRATAGDAYMLGHWINLVPFATIGAQVRATSGAALVQLIGNAGLLLPLGLIGPVLMPSLRRVSRLAPVALGAAVAIELVQLAATSARLINRSVDVDDLILNVAGALLGWVMWRGIAWLSQRVRRPAVPDESLS